MNATLDLAALFADVPVRTAGEAAAREVLLARWGDKADLLFGSWADIEAGYANYSRRLEFSVAHCAGRVLEIGCSIGNMTRWIAANPRVSAVLAVDRDPFAVAWQRWLGIDKTGCQVMPEAGPPDLPEAAPFDTLVACELIEHISTADERAMLDAFGGHLGPDTVFVISTPIGFMPDPGHVRGFSKAEFLDHVEGIYGTVDRVDYTSGYSQVAVGRLTRLAGGATGPSG